MGIRINAVNIFLGKRGTGKSWYVKYFLIPYYRKHHPEKKIFIFDTLDHPLYRDIESVNIADLKKIKSPGVYRCFSSDTDEILRQSENIYNALMIYEDASKYLRRQIPDTVRRFILDSKQKNADLVFLFHGFSFVPPEMFRISDGLLLFKCDNPAYRKADIVNYTEVEKTYNEVMKSKNPYFKKYVRIY